MSIVGLDGETFVQRMATLAAGNAEASEVPRAERRPQAPPLSHLVTADADPKECMTRAYRTGDYTLAQVAAAFGVPAGGNDRLCRRSARCDDILYCCRNRSMSTPACLRMARRVPSGISPA
jgi:hypothetical protein